MRKKLVIREFFFFQKNGWDGKNHTYWSVTGRIWFGCVAAEDTLKDRDCCSRAVLAVDRKNDGATKDDTFSGKTAVNQTNWRSFIINYCLVIDFKM